MSVDIKLLDKFVHRKKTAPNIADDVLIVLKHIWRQNDEAGGKTASSYIDKRTAARFLKSQGYVIGLARLTEIARQCGRFSWDQK